MKPKRKGDLRAEIIAVWRWYFTLFFNAVGLIFLLMTAWRVALSSIAIGMIVCPLFQLDKGKHNGKK